MLSGSLSSEAHSKFYALFILVFRDRPLKWAQISRPQKLQQYGIRNFFMLK